jgi:integrase
VPRQRGPRGAGSITRRDGKYRAVWSSTEGGKRVRKSATFTLRNDAEWWLREARRTGSAPADQTVGEYLEQWLARKRSLRESTRLQYTNHIRVHLVPGLGGIAVTRLSRRQVEAFVEDRSKHVSRSTHRVLTPSTVRSILTTLRSALEDGVPRELPDNVAKRVETPRVRRPPVHAMTIPEAGQIVDAFRGTWLEQLVRFLLGSGTRIGEALALDQVDIQEGFVRLRKSKTTLRAVPVSDDAAAALQEAIRLAPRRGMNEPVFFAPRPNRQGARDRLDRRSVNHAFTRILAENGLPHLSPHGLRHGTATLMLTGGASMQVIADQLGHRNPGLTARVYAHVDPILLRRAVQVLDDAVRKR